MQTIINLPEHSVADVQYTNDFVERGYRFDKSGSWVTLQSNYKRFLRKAESLEANVRIASLRGDELIGSLLYDIPDGIVALNLNRGGIGYQVASSSMEVIDKHIAALKKAFPILVAKDDTVKIRFWYATSGSPANVTRNIVVPDWDAIRENYEPNTLSSLEYLMEDFQPSAAGGQLIIFHGEPGTGKSYSLRALLDSWRDWCTADYVLDPENLFSGAQNYLASLVLRDSVDEYGYDDDDTNVKEGKWKVLILEDSGELLSADAKMRTGQGLSRLLNLVDGFIGQGLRVLVLITTNEQIEKLHPAVSREGRCAAAVKFRPFTHAQATKWLEKNKANTTQIPDSKNGGVTLADLYAHIRKGGENPRQKLIDMDLREIGFKMR